MGGLKIEISSSRLGLESYVSLKFSDTFNVQTDMLLTPHHKCTASHQAAISEMGVKTYWT